MLIDAVANVEVGKRDIFAPLQISAVLAQVRKTNGSNYFQNDLHTLLLFRTLKMASDVVRTRTATAVLTSSVSRISRPPRGDSADTSLRASLSATEARGAGGGGKDMRGEKEKRCY